VGWPRHGRAGPVLRRWNGACVGGAFFEELYRWRCEMEWSRRR
jgi:hypothetical protein